MFDKDLINEEPPTSIDPYITLNLPTSATSEEIRSAYKKLALRLHPDKAVPEKRGEAHKAFQELALAYAILGDERRRKRYDTSGNISESLDVDDDDFDWSDFFRAQYSELVTVERVEEFKRSYQGSCEERSDVLEAYRKGNGSLDKIFEEVLLSNPLDDEDRFRNYIDQAIKDGNIESLKPYSEESERNRQRRIKKAEKEAKEAEKHAEELGSKEKEARKSNKKKNGDLTDLALTIQDKNKNKAKSDLFLDGLLHKYGGGSQKASQKGATLPSDEPSEEAFAEMGKRKKRKAQAEGIEDDMKAPVKTTKARTRSAKKARN